MSEALQGDDSVVAAAESSRKRRRDGRSQYQESNPRSRGQHATKVPRLDDLTGVAPTVQTKSVKMPGSFADDASILLVGMSCAGKKTLGIMASLALHRPYVDFKSYFEKRVGVSISEYLHNHGIEAYRALEVETTARLLTECNDNHIISGLSDLGGSAVGSLVRQFAQSHPVIHIRRNKIHLKSDHLSSNTNFDRWFASCSAFYESCSNFDFYNLSFSPKQLSDRVQADTLKLKDTEIDFIRFVSRILGNGLTLLHSAAPLSPTFTYALQVPLRWLERTNALDELECGADIVNLLIDENTPDSDFRNRLAKQMARLRRHTRAPVMFEVIPRDSSSGNYAELLRLAGSCVPDFLAISLTNSDFLSGASLASLRYIKRIGIIHQKAWKGGWGSVSSFEDISELLSKCIDLSCEALRMTRGSSDAAENLACINFANSAERKSSIPVIAYNTGPGGYTSMCFNKILSPVVPPSRPFHGLTIKQAQSALYASFVATKKSFTIFGKSVSYSLSPSMHNAAYDFLGMPHSYDFHQSDDFLQVYDLLNDGDCGGVAVSLPYKSQALQLLDFMTEEVRQIGAVNTIVVEYNGCNGRVLKGYNTDHIGIRECVFRSLSPVNSIRSSSCALILGAGGMARATIFACRTLGLKNICLFNRTLLRAQELARSQASSGINIHVMESLDQQWPSSLRQPTVIVSTIPAHTIGEDQAHELNIPTSWLQSRTGGVFVELAYKPLETRLLVQMRALAAQGWVSIDGLDVLVAQGIAQFEILTQRPAPIHIMCEAARAQYDIANRAASQS